MSHKIRYKLSPGDVLRYQKDITLLIEEPSGLRYHGTATELMTQEVLDGNPSGWSMRLNTKTTAADGPLAADIPQELRQFEATLRMDERGNLLAVSNTVRVPQVPAFPEEELEAGLAWAATAPSPDAGPPMQVNYYLEKFEVLNSEVQASLVTTSSLSNEEQGYITETQASLLFSITKGHQISSTTVIKMVWKDGRVSNTVVELKLLDRATKSSN